MRSTIVVHPRFEAVWPWAANHARQLWESQGELEFIRLQPTDERPLGQVLTHPAATTRLLVLGLAMTPACLDALPNLNEIAYVPFDAANPAADAEIEQAFEARGVRWIRHRSEGFWGQSVSEFGLALTFCGLRRIPQTHRQIVADLSPWDYEPPAGYGQPGVRGQQFGDDNRFTSGTIEGKRARVVGAGNIASRYASFLGMLGADVAAWDPFASEPCFHLAGARREYRLDRLVRDAEIFAPMLPSTETTRGIVTAAHIDALPQGCLVVLVTRADICDTAALRRRVLADELALAADVFDIEPLPLGDALLGRHNVVHTPHNAGRTKTSNYRWAEALLDQFEPVV